MPDQTPEYPKTESPEMLELQRKINAKHAEHKDELQKARAEYASAMKSLKAMGEHQNKSLESLEEITKLIPELHEEARKPLI